MILKQAGERGDMQIEGLSQALRQKEAQRRAPSAEVVLVKRGERDAVVRCDEGIVGNWCG